MSQQLEESDIGNQVFDVDIFENDDLNELTEILYSLDEEASQNYEKAKEYIRSAFHNKWEFGEELWRYENIIFEHFDSWSEFAEKIGKSPSQVSRRFSGYNHLREAGAETWEEVVDLLSEKSIKLTAKNFEKIGRLLNEPEEDEKIDFDEQEPQDMNRLKEIESEAQDILARNENPNRNEPLPDKKVELNEQAEQTLQYVKDMREKLAKQDPFNVEFKSEPYLQFIREFGKDLITGEPSEHCDPHHTDPFNATGDYADKLPDWSAIPVSRETHDAITTGRLTPTPEQILKAQVKCLAIFIMTYATE